MVVVAGAAGAVAVAAGVAEDLIAQRWQLTLEATALLETKMELMTREQQRDQARVEQVAQQLGQQLGNDLAGAAQ